tara:strand:+ start:1216 stop:1506 length:291 start_codon:yes stop_codon:yes gene_type:complete
MDPDEHFEIMYYTALRWVVKQIKHENTGKSFLLANCIIGHTLSEPMQQLKTTQINPLTEFAWHVAKKRGLLDTNMLILGPPSSQLLQNQNTSVNNT